jgi:hypothetical protein
MVLEGLNVRHKTFGDGVIVLCESKYITVKFAETEKKFVYPDIFDKFLEPCDNSVIAEISADLERSKLLKQALIDKKNEENLRAMTKGIVIPGKFNMGNENGTDEREQSQEIEDI